jgi:hypothetical protein
VVSCEISYKQITLRSLMGCVLFRRLFDGTISVHCVFIEFSKTSGI